MKKREVIMNSKSTAKEGKRRTEMIRPVCWIAVPVAIVLLLVLDACGIFIFTKERLIVLGIGLLVILLPFFSEITIRNISVKRDKSDKDT